LKLFKDTTDMPRSPLFLLTLLLFPVAVSAQSLYSDFRARKPGDIITIILSERTSAQRASEWQNASSNGIGGTSGVTGGTDLSGRFALDAKFSKDAQNRNTSLQRDLLTGTITATITERDEGGNLTIQGERSLNVNGETHLMKVTGLVRTVDIRTNNSVMSFQIANANIEYRKKGGLTRGLFKPGKLVRFGVIAVLGGALAIGMQQ
jgi:flagellar L-ring protein FlgH